MRSVAECPDIVIANTGTSSNIVYAPKVHEDADDVTLMCLTIDGTKTYKIQINNKRDGSGEWYDLNDGTADITPPAVANRAIKYPLLNETFRILPSAAVAGECRWRMSKVYTER